MPGLNYWQLNLNNRAFIVRPVNLNKGENVMKERDFTVRDFRGQKKLLKVCRVCGSSKVHSKQYNNPTMECIAYLREIIKTQQNKRRKRNERERD